MALHYFKAFACIIVGVCILAYMYEGRLARKSGQQAVKRFRSNRFREISQAHPKKRLRLLKAFLKQDSLNQDEIVLLLALTGGTVDGDGLSDFHMELFTLLKATRNLPEKSAKQIYARYGQCLGEEETDIILGAMAPSASLA